MNIFSTQFDLYSKSLKIFISGCDGACKGCFNPSLWDFSQGESWENVFDEIHSTIKEYDEFIDRIQILGGEPLLNSHDDLANLLYNLVQYNKKIILFTRFELDKVPANIKLICDYIKTGMYDETKLKETTTYGIQLSSSNQKIWKKKGIEWI